ncbi:MAG: hypothetical protein IPP56_05855 [Bacteroidetes bacterium]|nr:hypothetical protein [Bacteroidota bacterium]
MEILTKKLNKLNLCFTVTVGLLAYSFASKATVMMVNNAGAGQYADLNTAYIAANVGDTLLISGSANEYSITGNWAKNLVVIGSGFNSSKQVFKEAKIGPATFFLASGSRFLGILFSSNVNFKANANSVYFESCKFVGDVWSDTYDLSNSTFLNCLFTNTNSNLRFGTSNVNSILVSHCILSGYVTGSNNNFVFDVNFDHCLFLRNSDCLSNVYNAVVSNSIFFGINPLVNVYNSSFNNNLSRLSVSNKWTLNGNTSTHDTDAVDPLFVNVPLVGNYSTTWDFHLQNGSPAIGWDSNGSDAGLHDITSSFDEAGEAQNIPVIRQMILQTATVPQNGSVTVKVRSTKSR